MRILVKLGVALLVALLLGVGSALYLINAGLRHGSVTNGPWVTNPSIGSVNADPYTRAAVARAGLLALDKSETIYFTAATDGAGHPLMTDCTYKLTGRDLPARWWSITVYGADHYLIPNPQGKYSISKNSIKRARDGSYTAIVSAVPSDGNWIPTGTHDDPAPFSLTIRLYNPEAAAYENLESLDLPTITEEACP